MRDRQGAEKRGNILFIYHHTVSITDIFEYVRFLCQHSMFPVYSLDYLRCICGNIYRPPDSLSSVRSASKYPPGRGWCETNLARSDENFLLVRGQERPEQGGVASSLGNDQVTTCSGERDAASQGMGGRLEKIYIRRRDR